MNHRFTTDRLTRSINSVRVAPRNACYSDLCGLAGMRVIDSQEKSLGNLRDLLLDFDSGLVTGCALESGLVATRVRVHFDLEQNVIRLSAPSWSRDTTFRTAHACQIMGGSLIGRPIVARSDDSAEAVEIKAGFVSGVITPVNNGPVRAAFVARGIGGVLGLVDDAALIPWRTLSFTAANQSDQGALRTAQSLTALDRLPTWSARESHPFGRGPCVETSRTTKF